MDKIAKVAGALDVAFHPLRSPYPFHSPLLSAAAVDFERRIRHIRQRPTEIDVFSPILGRIYQPSDDLTAALSEHLVRPVGYAGAVREVYATGVGMFVESGGLDALTKIAGRVLEGRRHQAMAVLTPTHPISDALDALAVAGVATTGSADLSPRNLLLPELDSAEFSEFWRDRGARVVEFARLEYAAAMRDRADGEPSQEFSSSTADVPAAPAPSNEPGRRPEVIDSLVTMYAEALEYPTEVFEEDTDLEGELGVDSVKQMELLARVSDRFGLPPRPADFGVSEHNTLGRIADLVLAAG